MREEPSEPPVIHSDIDNDTRAAQFPPAMTETNSPVFPAALSSQFELVRPLGAGGMGAVWLVRDRMLDRLVALKVLLAERGGEAERERFLREARTAAKLEHPNIVPIFRADETAGTTWFSMGFVEGESLGERLRDRGKLSPAEVVRSLREASWALAYAHARAVVHRDVKPDNFMLDRESGRTLVTDFGIARDVSSDKSRLTLDGNVLGTVHYMSPEQCAGEPLDGRSDVYALGVVGFQALSGTLPFDGPPQSVLVAHVTKQAPALRSVAPQIPDALAAVIDRCLAKSPADRYETAESLASALEQAMAEAVEASRSAEQPGPTLSEDEAMAVWQRAAQLQAEAAHRMERNVSINRDQTAQHAAVSDTLGYSARDVEASAVDAGISRQYVAIAMAERQSQQSNAPMLVGEREDRRVTTLLGVTARSISVSRTITASPRATLEALGRVATAKPYQLSLESVVGGHPLDGGILRFKVPTIYEAMSGQMVSIMSGLVYRCTQIDLYELNITLAARGTPARPTCEVVISGDLRKGQRKNVRFSGWTMGTLGTVFGGVAGTLAGLAAGSVLVAIGPAVGAAAGIAALSGYGYRWAYRSALTKTQEELEGLLRAVQRSFDEAMIFGALPPRNDGPPPGSGGSDAAAIITLLSS